MAEHVDTLKYPLVSREEFMAAIGAHNVTPRPERDACYWETPARLLLGVTTPGYMGEGGKTWRVRRDLVGAGKHG